MTYEDRAEIVKKLIGKTIKDVYADSTEFHIYFEDGTDLELDADTGYCGNPFDNYDPGYPIISSKLNEKTK